MKIKYPIFENIIKYLFLFILGGSIYYGIEILYRGYSHYVMIAVGGICFICIGLLNEIFPWDVPIWYQVLFGDFIVLAIEYCSGCILNIWLGLGIWDYSALPMNLDGQICLYFAFLWLPIILLAIVVDDYSRWLFCNEEKPRYNWSFVYSF